MAGALYYKKHSVVYVIDIYGHLCCNYEAYCSKKCDFGHCVATS